MTDNMVEIKKIKKIRKYLILIYGLLRTRPSSIYYRKYKF